MGVGGGFGTRSGAGLGENVIDMAGNRVEADHQFLGDRLVALARCDEAQPFNRPLRQLNFKGHAAVMIDDHPELSNYAEPESGFRTQHDNAVWTDGRLADLENEIARPESRCAVAQGFHESRREHEPAVERDRNLLIGVFRLKRPTVLIVEGGRALSEPPLVQSFVSSRARAASSR